MRYAQSGLEATGTLRRHNQSTRRVERALRTIASDEPVTRMRGREPIRAATPEEKPCVHLRRTRLRNRASGLVAPLRSLC